MQIDCVVEAVRLLARTEAILLDPVYADKMMTGLTQRAMASKAASGALEKFHFNSNKPNEYVGQNPITHIIRSARRVAPLTV